MHNYDPFDLQGQHETEEDKRLREKLARESEESDFKWLMGSKRGRRIIWRLMDQAGVFRPVFNTTAMQMAFNEGFRNYGLRTLHLIHAHAPELYHVMSKENTNVGRTTEHRTDQ